jgi:uncharacterized protein
MMIDQFSTRRLQPAAHSKPFDFGSDGLTGSINRDGRIVSLNAYHAEQGYITVTALPPFDETQRYNPAAVRAYRRSLADAPGFGLRLDDLPVIEREYALLEDAIPYLRFHLADGNTLEIITFATEYKGTPHVFYWCRGSAGLGTVRFDGQVWIQRCAYSQLTEGGPLPMPPVNTRILKPSPAGVTLINDALKTVLASNITGAENDGDGVRFDTQVDLDGEALIVFRLGTVGDDTSLTQPTSSEIQSLLSSSLETWRRRWQGWPHADHPLDLPLRRALVYALHCCVPVDEQAVCVITDHQLLPLSWTRDAYYTIMPLLQWQPEFADLVRRHLVWLFERAERPQGNWGRAYLANGKVKDPAMQLDQQLYPLLELADYTDITGDRSLWQQMEGSVHQVLNMLLDIRDRGTGLFPTHETPADDPVHQPFHLSGHILFWYTLQRLAQVTDAQWGTLAGQIYEAIQRYFVTEWQGRPIYAYLTDGTGNYQFYQDANDLPLALAPLWGFCTPDDEAWRNTMAFSFSADNTGGFYGAADDPYPGLGSVHTPDAWHLGSVQEYLYAQITGDAAGKNRVIQKIAQTMQWDGGLSEAFSAKTGEVVSRHWFAWPNAALHLCRWD